MNFYFNAAFALFLKNGVRLIPGNNSLTKEQAEECLKFEDVQERIRIGQIKLTKDAEFEELVKETKIEPKVESEESF